MPDFGVFPPSATAVDRTSAGFPSGRCRQHLSAARRLPLPRRDRARRNTETYMRLHTVGVIITLTLSLLFALLPSTAQPSGSVPRIGVLVPTSAEVAAPSLQAFRQPLRAFDYAEGQSLTL